MYYVTQRHGPAFPFEIERLWSTLAASKRNIIPILDFLTSLGVYAALQVRWVCVFECVCSRTLCVHLCVCANGHMRMGSCLPPLFKGQAHLLRERLPNSPPNKQRNNPQTTAGVGVPDRVLWRGQAHLPLLRERLSNSPPNKQTTTPNQPQESASLTEYFGVAKRIALYLARISPQHTIDHLAYEINLQARALFLTGSPQARELCASAHTELHDPPRPHELACNVSWLHCLLRGCDTLSCCHFHLAVFEFPSSQLPSSQAPCTLPFLALTSSFPTPLTTSATPPASDTTRHAPRTHSVQQVH